MRVGVEELDASAAVLLCRIQRDVGVAQQRVGVGGREVADANADAGGEVEFASLVGEGSRERGEHALGDRERLVFAGVLAQDRELVTAEARDRVLGATRL